MELTNAATKIEAELKDSKEAITTYFNENSLTGKQGLSRVEVYDLLNAISRGKDSFHVQSYNIVFRHWGLLTALVKQDSQVKAVAGNKRKEKMYDILMRICDKETIAKAEAEYALEGQKAKLLQTGLSAAQIKAIAATL